MGEYKGLRIPYMVETGLPHGLLAPLSIQLPLTRHTLHLQGTENSVGHSLLNMTAINF